MANCVLPEDIMLCILTRLPVKTILRFKSVCKPWLDLFSTPEFKKLHLDQFSSDPENKSFIVYSYGEYCSEPKIQYSIFNIESGKKPPTILDHPFAHTQNPFETVGCCSGLVCIRSGQDIVLWNPAMKLSKTVPLKDCGPSEMVLLGFGYDAVGADFKVVRVVGEISSLGGKGMNVTYVEIYSVNLDSWITINVGFQFSEFRARDIELEEEDELIMNGNPDIEYGGEHLIVNGNPYWFARVDGKEVLVCFDVMELVFKIVPFPPFYWDGWNEEEKIATATQVDLVDWNGTLGAIMSILTFVPTNEEYHLRVESLWVFDDVKQIWRKNKTYAPIEVDVGSVLHYTKNDKVSATLNLSSDTLFVLDSEAGCVKELFDRACLGSSFKVSGYEIYGYTESLAYINGMEKVVVRDEQKDLDDCLEDEVGVC